MHKNNKKTILENAFPGLSYPSAHFATFSYCLIRKTDLAHKSVKIRKGLGGGTGTLPDFKEGFGKKTNSYVKKNV